MILFTDRGVLPWVYNSEFTTMKDCEVGELWRKHRGKIGLEHHHVVKVIRKLVEERASHIYHGHNRYSWSMGQCRECALRDFGIEPATWKETL